jgi:hypothetical protein
MLSAVGRSRDPKSHMFSRDSDGNTGFIVFFFRCGTTGCRAVVERFFEIFSIVRISDSEEPQKIQSARARNHYG